MRIHGMSVTYCVILYIRPGAKYCISPRVVLLRMSWGSVVQFFIKSMVEFRSCSPDCYMVAASNGARVSGN